MHKDRCAILFACLVPTAMSLHGLTCLLRAGRYKLDAVWSGVDSGMPTTRDSDMDNAQPGMGRHYNTARPGQSLQDIIPAPSVHWL